MLVFDAVAMPALFGAVAVSVFGDVLWCCGAVVFCVVPLLFGVRMLLGILAIYCLQPVAPSDMVWCAFSGIPRLKLSLGHSIAFWTICLIRPFLSGIQLPHAVCLRGCFWVRRLVLASLAAVRSLVVVRLP